MIPQVSMTPHTSSLPRAIKISRQPSRTYALDIQQGRIRGMIEGLEAVKQAVYKILSTQRLEYLIYSFKYGTEIRDLAGSPPAWAEAVLEMRIREALLWDDRVKQVQNFSFKRNREILTVAFSVITTEGMADIQKEVEL